MSPSRKSVFGRLPVSCVPFMAGNCQLELLKYQRGESDLALIDGEFYLFATCEVGTSEPVDVEFEISLGIKNIAADSLGETYAGNHLNSLREKRHAKLRAKLQAKGTRSAKRLLKKRRRKEQRMANTRQPRNRQEIVEKAKDTGLGIALEELANRERVTVRKASRRRRSSWASRSLRAKITHKASFAGVPVVLVDPGIPAGNVLPVGILIKPIVSLKVLALSCPGSSPMQT